MVRTDLEIGRSVASRRLRNSDLPSSHTRARVHTRGSTLLYFCYFGVFFARKQKKSEGPDPDVRIGSLASLPATSPVTTIF